MRTTATPLFLLAILHAVCGQLNFEGNPLTEDTVYTAEESHFAEKTAKARALETSEPEDSYLLAAKILKAERSQSSYPINDDGAKYSAHLSSRNDVSSAGSSSANYYRTLPNEILKKSPAPVNDAVSGTQTSETPYSKRIESQDQAYAVSAETSNPQLSNSPDPALVMFLNSKTPQESRMALEEYLIAGQRAAQTVNDSPSPYQQPHISEIVLPQQQLINVEQQLKQIGQVQDARYSQYAHSEYPDSQSLQSIGMSDQAPFVVNRQIGPNRRSSTRGPPPPYGRRSYVVRPPYDGTIYRAQSRIGPAPGYRKGPYGSSGHGGGSPEIIYTKPPGYGKSQYERGKNPYEDASAWFPDANYPPPDVNVYHSQLYAQSYDPHYYNYIAKYGKIKPHLYGKFEKKEESFLWELFRSFKKHGMKHVMNPMFLLGLGIPMVTLMLSALVNKRSFARSNSGIDGDIHITDEEIDEWVTKLRKALECHAQSASESERMKCAVLD